MNNLDILFIDDDERWHDEVRKVLQKLGGEVRMQSAYNYEEGLQSIERESYDLAIFDLSLLNVSHQSIVAQEVDFQGLELMQKWQQSHHNSGSGMIVLSGYYTPRNIRDSYHKHGVDDFIDKGEPEWDDQLLNAARCAILEGRLRHAAIRDDARYLLSITYTHDSFVGSRLTGPEWASTNTINPPFSFNIDEIARRANEVDQILENEEPAWRPEAIEIGKAIYATLECVRCISAHMTTARAKVKHSRDVWIQFCGPSKGLGIPFELLHDGNDYSCFKHILTRQVVGALTNDTSKPEAFYKFISTLQDRQEELSVLVVGSNSDGRIDSAEVEATTLSQNIKADLERLGIRCYVKPLTGDEANYDKVCAELEKHRYHLFHYAGHCEFDEARPEASGLVLPHGNRTRILSANRLNMMTCDSPLRLVYLSCCLGARTADRLGHSDFYGVLEALSRADVPIVLGYRWTVADKSALHLSKVFYRTLWRNFSPGEALLEARRSIAMSGPERDDDTLEALERDDDAWASPVLLMQNVNH